MKTEDLQGAALDWAVAKCEGNGGVWYETDKDPIPFTPSTDWAHGGPIIEREKMQLWIGLRWNASMESSSINPAEFESGPTPLIAAMRCYVASKFGEEIDIPKELEAV